MKPSMFMLMLLCICAAILASLGIYTQARSGSDQEAERDRLIERNEELQSKVTDLLQEQVRLSEELRELAQRPATVFVTNTPATNTVAPPAYRQPFFAKTYLDGDFVGLAKVSPVFREDPATGQTVFENIVLLGADARAAVVKTVTNVVEREVVRNNTLNNNYPTQPYVYTYPVWVRQSTNNVPPSGMQPRPPRQNPPATGAPNWPQWENGGTWRPETIRENPVVGTP